MVTLLLIGLGIIAAPSARAAEAPGFPMVLPVGWGEVVQAGGTHTHTSGVRSSIDLGAAGNRSVDVVAAADGGIIDLKANCQVVVQHQDGWQTRYYHLKSIPSGLAVGQEIGALTNLDASYVTTGTVAPERLGYGSADNTTFLDGTNTWSHAVTSVGLSTPVEFNPGPPVTTSGNLTFSKENQSANTVWAGPNTGSPAQPVFRALVAADIPALDASKIATGIMATARLGSGIRLRRPEAQPPVAKGLS